MYSYMYPHVMAVSVCMPERLMSVIIIPMFPMYVCNVMCIEKEENSQPKAKAMSSLVMREEDKPIVTMIVADDDK